MKRRLGMTTPTPSNDIDLCLALVPCATSVLQVVFTPKVGPAGVLVLWDDYTCEGRIIP